jgi:hypothetical protein
MPDPPDRMFLCRRAAAALMRVAINANESDADSPASGLPNGLPIFAEGHASGRPGRQSPHPATIGQAVATGTTASAVVGGVAAMFHSARASGRTMDLSRATLPVGGRAGEILPPQTRTHQTRGCCV